MSNLRKIYTLVDEVTLVLLSAHFTFPLPLNIRTLTQTQPSEPSSSGSGTKPLHVVRVPKDYFSIQFYHHYKCLKINRSLSYIFNRNWRRNAGRLCTWRLSHMVSRFKLCAWTSNLWVCNKCAPTTYILCQFYFHLQNCPYRRKRWQSPTCRQSKCCQLCNKVTGERAFALTDSWCHVPPDVCC